VDSSRLYGMNLQDLQRDAVDAIKRHAARMSLGSQRAEAHILTEYLWCEESSEAEALERALSRGTPGWVGKLITNQLADERRHAELFRERLAALGTAIRPPPALARAKLWWIERAVRPYLDRFAAGPIVVMLAVAAQLEATGVRMFSRHLGVLEARERAKGAIDPTAELIRTIVADERRHASGCAGALARLVSEDEQDDLAQLREQVATIDRAFGVTMAIGHWMWIAAYMLRDRAVRS
jgi:hypothetical protein